MKLDNGLDDDGAPSPSPPTNASLPRPARTLIKPSPLGAGDALGRSPTSLSNDAGQPRPVETVTTPSPPPATHLLKSIVRFGRGSKPSDAKDVVTTSRSTSQPKDTDPSMPVEKADVREQPATAQVAILPPTPKQPDSATETTAPAARGDTLSQHISARSNADQTSPRPLHPAPPHRPDSPEAGDVPTELPTARLPFSGEEPKDKKKTGFFRSRLSMRVSRKKEPETLGDTDSELSERPRLDGRNAPVFSGIVGGGGYIPIHKEPPRYIRVKAVNKKTRDFHRMFLAQELAQDIPGEEAPLGQEGAAREAGDARKSMSTVGKDDRSLKSVDRRKTRAAIWATEFSRDGRYLATAGKDAVVRVWAVLSSPAERRADAEATANGSSSEERLSAPVFRQQPVACLVGHESDVLDLSWSKNNFLLSCGMDKTVRLWHLSRKECLCTFKHKDIVTKIAFHPTDDRFFLAGSLDSVLRLWSIPDKAVVFSAQLPDMVTAVALTPDGKTAIAGMLTGLCHFYETEGLKLQFQIHVRSSRGKNAKGSKITGIQTMLIPPPPLVPSIQRPGSSASSRPDLSVTSPATLGPAGARGGEVKVLVTSNDSRIRIYDLKDKSLELKLKGHENMVSQIAARFSDDGRYIISGSENSRSYIWGLEGLAEEPNKDKWPVEYFDAHSGVVTSAVMAPTKTRMVLNGSGDPVYDLCNPPPVTLLSMEDMESEARASATSLGLAGSAAKEGDHGAEQRKKPAEHAHDAVPSAAYIARSTHYDGNIVVTASDSGSIKVFRQDCAFGKRRHDWETASIGRTIVHGPAAHAINNLPLGRSASILTRTSASSAAHSRRGSLSLAANGQVAPVGSPQLGSDRILTWRQGIEGHRASLASTPTSRSERSISPGKSGHEGAAKTASEARRMPYAQHSVATSSAANSPTAGVFTQRFGARRKVLESATQVDEVAPTDAVGPAGTNDQDSTGKAMAARDNSISKSRERGSDTEAGEDMPSPPLPSFTFRPVEDNGDQLRLDPAGASYSFWNLNRWRGGIASIRDSVSGGAGGSSGGSQHRPPSDKGVGSLIPGFSLLNTVKERDANTSPEAEGGRPQEKDKDTPRGRSERRKSLGAGKMAEADKDAGDATVGNDKLLETPQLQKHNRRKSTPPLTTTIAQTLSNVLPSILSPAPSTKSAAGQAQVADTRPIPADASTGDVAPSPIVPPAGGEPGFGPAKPGSDLLAPPADAGSRRTSHISSGGSVISQLSDEFTSSDGEELRCPNCGGKDFKARRVGGRQRLLCGQCGQVLHTG